MDQERQQQWALFLAAMRVFENYDSKEETVATHANRIRTALRETPGAEALEILREFAYWRKAFDEARVAETRDAVKKVIRARFCTVYRHATPKSNVAQGLMKAATHVVWKKLYTLEAGQPRTDITQAVRDAIVPPPLRGAEFFREIVAEIAAESGETVEELMARLDPAK